MRKFLVQTRKTIIAASKRKVGLNTVMKIVPVIMMGIGECGRALARRILARDFWWAGREGFSFKLRALVDSVGAVAGEPFLDEATAREALSLKERGRPLPAGHPAAHWLEVLPTDVPAIVVDATRSQHSGPGLLEAVRRGHAVVLINDTPLLGSPASFRLLTADRRTRFEAAIGVGAPIAELVERLTDVGETPSRIEATLNPALTALFAKMESGYVSKHEMRAALDDHRASRQALILSRCLGSDLRLESIHAQPVLIECDVTEVERLATRMAQAQRAGRTLRHVATITSRRVSLAIKEVSITSPLALQSAGVKLAVWCAGAEPAFIIHGPPESAERAAVAALADMLVLAREENKPWRSERLARNQAN
jgi:homoserine dehydrogenase